MGRDPQYYVYAHRRESDGRLFYVGKGKDRRAWSVRGRTERWHRVTGKHGFAAEIVRDALPEACALTLERIVIAANKAAGLINVQPGGSITSMPRPIPTEETRKKMSEAAKARPRRPVSAETRAKIAAAHIGIRPSLETLRKMSASKIGKAVGKDSPSYDHTIRHWRNDDAREFIGTRGDFIKEFGLKDGCVCTVIKGRQKSVKGWRLV